MPETIGQRLQTARLSRRISLEQAAEETRIRLPYLQALEADDFSALPSAVHARGFLRSYAAYLGLDFNELSALLNISPSAEEIKGPLPRLDSTPPPATSSPAPASSPSPLASLLERWRARPAAAPPSTDAISSPPAAGEGEPPAPASAQADTMPQKKRKASRTAAGNKKGEEIQPNGVNPARVRTESPEKPAGGEEKPTLAPSEQGEDQASIQSPLEMKEGEEPSAEEILRQIGQQLRQRRELLSLTLDEIERHVHIRTAFLQALEEGADDRLPAPVQTRGMLANYAAFLDLNVDELLLRYAEALQIRHRKRHPYRFRPRKGLAPAQSILPPLRPFIAADVLFGVGMAVMLIALAIWGLGRAFTPPSAQEPLPTAPSIPEVLASVVPPTITQEVTLIPAADTPLPTAETIVATMETPTPLPPNVNVMVMIVAMERTFMRVLVDGQVAFDGRVVPGSAYPFEAQSQIAVLTGNGAALRVTYNGQDMGFLGGVGEVVNVIYTVSGVMTPTLTPSATATLTPVVTPSRTPTLTPTASSTFTPTPTATIRP